MTSLQSQFEKSVGGEGHCVFISGESGIGKTSLVKAFCSGIKNEATIYTGACDASFTPRPLAPLYDIAWHIRNDFWEDINTIEDRASLFTRFLHEFSKRQQVVLIFEDIHWADEATLDFIMLKGGMQNKEIASTFFISVKTVDHQISSILFKLEVNSRSKAVQEAMRLEIIK